jgi:hypothetical protein
MPMRIGAPIALGLARLPVIRMAPRQRQDEVAPDIILVKVRPPPLLSIFVSGLEEI